MKISLLAGAALAAVACASIATPAHAATDPMTQMAATCAATTIVNPDPNSTYVASFDTILSTVVGAEYEQSRTTISSTPGGVLLGTTPATFLPGTEGRMGGSPNIHGEFKSTATYSGGSLVQQVTYAQDTTYTFKCKVTKTNRNGNVTQPPGLQPAPQTLVVTNQTRTEQVTASAPNVTADYFTQAVICISPGTRRGEWRQQNGYTGICSTERYLALGTAFVHTNSVPNLPPINAQADHAGAGNDQTPMPAAVVDDEPREDATT